MMTLDNLKYQSHACEREPADARRRAAIANIQMAYRVLP
jgi:hypothetical protein